MTANQYRMARMRSAERGTLTLRGGCAFAENGGTLNDLRGPESIIEHRSVSNEQRGAAIAANADAVGPDFIRNYYHPAGRADVGVWGAQRPGARSRGDHAAYRDGRDVVYSLQLWTYGTRISERGFSVYLCGSRDQSCSWLHHRVEHGDGLHLESHDLHHLVQPAGACIYTSSALRGVGSLLRSGFYGLEYSRDQDLGAR